MYGFLRVLALLIIIGLIGLAGFWFVTRPDTLPDDTFTALSGDAEAGEAVFWAGGCASCHAAPGAEGDEERLVLAGGQTFATEFGSFVAPNISPTEAGIAGWSVDDLGNAMMRGVSPEGQHYYPAFPYTSYSRAAPQDIADLHAFLQTLPASDVANQPHDIGFPFSIRRLLGGWKMLFFRDDWVVTDVAADDVARGRYLVESLGHCSECHTPRNAIGGLDKGRWMAGAPSPDGKGKVPAITPDALDWSAGDIAAYLETGFTPEFDSAGGEMADVVQNLSHLPKSDLEAIAAYLKVLPASE